MNGLHGLERDANNHVVMCVCRPIWDEMISQLYFIQTEEKQLSVDWKIIFLYDRTVGFQSEAIGVQLVILQVEHCSTLIVLFRVFMSQRHEEQVWQIYCCLNRQLWPTPQPKCLGLEDRRLLYLWLLFSANV